MATVVDTYYIYTKNERHEIYTDVSFHMLTVAFGIGKQLSLIQLKAQTQCLEVIYKHNFQVAQK